MHHGFLHCNYNILSSILRDDKMQQSDYKGGWLRPPENDFYT